MRAVLLTNSIRRFISSPDLGISSVTRGTGSKKAIMTAQRPSHQGPGLTTRVMKFAASA
jgi:hypothetical protein